MFMPDLMVLEPRAYCCCRSKRQLKSSMGALDIPSDQEADLSPALLAHMKHSTDPEADRSLR